MADGSVERVLSTCPRQPRTMRGSHPQHVPTQLVALQHSFRAAQSTSRPAAPACTLQGSEVTQIFEMLIEGEPLAAVLGRVAGIVESNLPGVRVAVIAGETDSMRPLTTPEFTEVGFAAMWDELARSQFWKCALSSDGGCTCHCLGDQQNAWPKMSGAGVRGLCVSPLRSDSGRLIGALVLLHIDERCICAAGSVFEQARRIAAIAIGHRHVQHNLIDQSRHDRLTGLPNRWYLETRLEEALAAAERTRRMCALLWINLDRFRAINDALGHRFGDDILIQAGSRLSAAIPRDAVLARIGGDEFAMLLPSVENADSVQSVAQRLCDEFRKPFETDGYELFVTASIGYCLFPEDGHDGADLQRAADIAMSNAKAHGRNSAHRYERRLGVSSRARLEVEHSLCQALPRSEFELYYQPQLDINHRLRGVEALLRWHNPKHGLLIPRDFVHIAEDRGLIVPVGAWVIEQACRQLRAWKKAGFTDIKMAVNVSGLQFYHSDFVTVVERAISASGIEPSRLELELTESVLLLNFDESSRQMERVRRLGVTIAIDDFGTGYSSLNYLRRLPADTLKIDGSFVQEIGDPATMSVLEAVASLAGKLGLTTIAEGVETDAQFTALRGLGITAVQGYLFSIPLPANRAVEYFESLRHQPTNPLSS